MNVRQWLKVDLKLSRKGLILVFVPMSVILVIMFFLSVLLNEAEYDVWRESESKMVISKANALSRDFMDAWRLGQSLPVSKRTAAYALLEEDIVEQIQALNELTIDNTVQAGNITNLTQLANHGLHLLENSQPLNVFVDQLNAQVKMVEDKEQEELSKNLLKSSNTRSFVLHGLYLGVILNIVLAMMMATYFSKGITQRLSLVFENSKRLAKGQPLLPLQEGRDEIARLDRVFHTMAETLAELNRKQVAMMDNAVDVIFTVDNNGNFGMINNACRLAWGYEPEELIGQSLTKVLHPSDRALTMVLINRLMKGAANRTFESRVVRKDGKTIDLLWSAIWSKVEKCLFCVAHDITQRKEIERVKQDFFAMISHDLRTPLMSVLFSLNIVSKRIENLTLQLKGRQAAIVSAELTEEIRAAEHNCGHLLKLIDSILVIEKIESGEIELAPSMFKLSDLISRASESVNAYARQKEIALNCTFTEATIAADEDRLLQVLINLLGNAIKFSPAASQIKLIAGLENGNFVCQVEDKGPGIAAEHQLTIFDRYRQVKNSGENNEGGSGLGLTICRAIVKAHRGDIGVKSALGEGSTFWFKIPVMTLSSLPEDDVSVL